MIMLTARKNLSTKALLSLYQDMGVKWIINY